MSNSQVKGTPFFTDTQNKIKQHPYLNKNIKCDVLIIGGGIDGAITAYFLAKSGVSVAVIDKSRFGMCSTSCATALLEYQLDEHSHDLEKYLSKPETITAYKLGLSAIKDIAKIVTEIGNECHFSQKPTLVYSQKKLQANSLEKEYEFRKENGFNVKLLTQENSPFNFNFENALYCPDGGAEFNPYLFTKQLLSECRKMGVKLYEHTTATKIDYSLNETLVHTSYQNTIKCKKVICCTGYNTDLFTQTKLCDKFVSYSIVTSPLENFTWHKQTLLHDTESPYHYIRLTHDNRIILGGEDTKLKDNIIDTKTANEKYENLENYLNLLFPQLENNYTIDYKFCGTFGTTKNNLGIVGPTKNNPHLWYMLGYGANGIINSIYGAQMLVDLYNNKTHPALYMFSPDRDI